MKHFFSLILFSFIVSLATISEAYSQILPERERATLRDEILKDRFDSCMILKFLRGVLFREGGHTSNSSNLTIDSYWS